MMLSVSVLGPLEISVDGRRLDIRGARQRALLAALVLGRRTVLSVDRLVDVIFSEAPPRQARNATQTCVARLRRMLGPAAPLLRTHPAGYLLDLPGEVVDADRFAALLADRSGMTAAAMLARIEEALALWRGPAYGEFSDTLARAEAVRLEQRRRDAEDLRVELLLELSRVDEAVAEASALVAVDLLRDRPLRTLMLALEAAGRTAEALDVYRRHREWLRDELGLDPSSHLQAVHKQILSGREQPAQPSTRPGVVARPSRPRPPRPPWIIGRDQELAEVAEELTQTPLVTLVGPGGVGKSTIARALQPRWWVDLAALTEEEAVGPAVAAAVGLRLDPGLSVQDALRGWAAGAEGLLVLDSCEHLMPAAAAVVRVLHGPGLRLVATSRERFGLPGERMLVVGPLPRADAVRLFIDRAGEAAPGFDPDARLLGRIEEICADLDRLPLAIELAAARIGTLTIDDLADHLDTRLDLLDNAHRQAEPRHRTLRAVIDWSYRGLTPEERLAFRRLSVFAAEFDITSAGLVISDDALPVGRVAHLVARLSDRSMLSRPGPAGIGRCRMLRSLRIYADEQLTATERDASHRRHALFLADLVENAGDEWTGAREAACNAQVQRWLPDLQSAWCWIRKAGEMDLAVRVSAGIRHYAAWRLRPDLLAWSGWVLKHAPGHPALAECYAAVAAARWMEGDLDLARDLAAQAVTHAGTPRLSAVAWETVGDIALLRGELTEAIEAYRRLATLATDPGTVSVALAGQALALGYAGQPEALATARQAVAGAHSCGNPTALAYALFAEAEVVADDDPSGALASLEEARRIADQVGNELVSGITRTALVALRGRHGPPEPALALFHETLTRWVATGNQPLLAIVLRNLVILFARTGRDAAAAQLAASLRCAAANRSYGVEADRTEHALELVRRRLGDAAYRAAWELGAQRGVEPAALRALDELAPAVSSAGVKGPSGPDPRMRPDRMAPGSA